MQVQCSEGVANHTDPESCGVRREAHVEALTGDLPGWVLSHEMTFRMPTLFEVRKATRSTALCELYCDPAWSKTPAWRDVPCAGTGRSRG